MKNLTNVYTGLSDPSKLMLIVALVSVLYSAIIEFDLSILLGTLVYVVIQVYTNDCLVRGKCVTWAWVLSGLFVAATVLTHCANAQKNNNNN